ncbi:MAG: hypothetical protein ACOYOK_02815 [Pseudobdellovibrionaceae bacterium]
MNAVQLEIIQQNSAGIDEVYGFWIREWSRVLQSLVGKDATPEMFHEQSYFYVLKNKGEIVGVMSSSWQSNFDSQLGQDQYYAAFTQGPTEIKRLGINTFHKMGMIIADLKKIPRGLKLAPTIIGCGIRFTAQLPECQGVVSFPRKDTSVYRSCMQWGFRTIKEDLTMFNAPVCFVLLLPNEVTVHPEDQVQNMVDNLWFNREEKLIKNIAA